MDRRQLQSDALSADRSASCPPEYDVDRGDIDANEATKLPRLVQRAGGGDSPPKFRSTSVSGDIVARQLSSPVDAEEQSKSYQTFEEAKREEERVDEARRLATSSYDQWRQEVGMKASPLAVAKALGLARGVATQAIAGSKY